MSTKKKLIKIVIRKSRSFPSLNEARTDAADVIICTSPMTTLSRLLKHTHTLTQTNTVYLVSAHQIDKSTSSLHTNPHLFRTDLSSVYRSNSYMVQRQYLPAEFVFFRCGLKVRTGRKV